jgi:hypothetical protein
LPLWKPQSLEILNHGSSPMRASLRGNKFRTMLETQDYAVAGVFLENLSIRMNFGNQICGTTQKKVQSVHQMTKQERNTINARLLLSP